LRTLLISFLLLPALASAQSLALEDCPRYAPSTLETWIASAELHLAAQAYACRVINIDATLMRARSEGLQPDDAATWLEAYSRTLDRIREAAVLNRRWGTAEGMRNLTLLSRLELKYRRLAER
jgi:hypothetical protein